jgi:thiamine pyrophosphokinase
LSNLRAVIFANGEVPDYKTLASIIRADDVLICADGGLRHTLALGLRPRILIGDLDSVEPGQVLALEAQGIEILRYPVEKDETDLELSLEWAISEGCRELVVAGGLGGRIDHVLANLALINHPKFIKKDIRLDDGSVEVFLIHGEAHLQGKAGDLVSLLPVDEETEGVETQGLRYPLRGETLYGYRTRGVSNEMLTAEAVIRVRKGGLLCVHTRVA